jgi:hypothetical protein
MGQNFSIATLERSLFCRFGQWILECHKTMLNDHEQGQFYSIVLYPSLPYYPTSWPPLHKSIPLMTNLWKPFRAAWRWGHINFTKYYFKWENPTVCILGCNQCDILLYV